MGSFVKSEFFTSSESLDISESEGMLKSGNVWKLKTNFGTSEGLFAKQGQIFSKRRTFFQNEIPFFNRVVQFSRRKDHLKSGKTALRKVVYQGRIGLLIHSVSGHLGDRDFWIFL